jgi:nitrous oxidase accessory protein NosD
VLAHRSEAAPAAAIQRTFVSTSGNDANPCTRTAPCRNFSAAIPNTLAGGEVVALDSGGYGAFTISKSLTVAGAPGAHVAVTAFSGDAVTVDAGASDTVVLRNLYVTGLGGDAGIFFVAGRALRVQDVVATGFGSYGLDAIAPGANLFVGGSSFHDNRSGLAAFGNLHVFVEGSRADGNADNGFIFFDGPVGTVRRSGAFHNHSDGFLIQADANPVSITLADSVADFNGTGVVVLGTDAVANLTGDVLSNNGLGLELRTSSGTPLARIAASTVTGNFIGLLNNGATLESYGDNMVRGNTTDTSGAITAVAKT